MTSSSIFLARKRLGWKNEGLSERGGGLSLQYYVYFFFTLFMHLPISLVFVSHTGSHSTARQSRERAAT